MIEYDNRYLWMNQKTLKGCHFANYREAWEANRLVCEGRIHPMLSAVFAFERHRRGRVRRCTTTCTRASSACSSSRPRRGSASTDPEMRERLLDQITLFRRHQS